MIRNLVFDMGGVLFTYDPAAFVRKYCPNPQDADLVNRELFGAPEWAELDRGTMEDAEYLSLILTRVPERLQTVTAYLFRHWHEMPCPLPEMEPLVRALKESGKKIYLLSNMSARFYRFYRKIPAMRHFDGMLVSADVHAVKPDPEIYRVLFDRFGLTPEECFFVDDTLQNVKAGEKLGMRGFWFRRDVGALRAALRAAEAAG